MPRKTAYDRNPEKYRKQRKEYYYSNNEYVPRKPRKKEETTFGYSSSITSNKVKSNVDVVSSIEDLTKKALEKNFSKKYVPIKLRSMRRKQQCYSIGRDVFMTVSNYFDYLQGQSGTNLSSSSKRGREGILKVIPYLKESFPSPNYLIFLNPIDQKGVDVLILKDGEPHTVMELTYYSKTSYLHTKDIERYQGNLNSWETKNPNIQKVLVVNYRENLVNNPHQKNAYRDFLSEGIEIKILSEGFQCWNA